MGAEGHCRYLQNMEGLEKKMSAGKILIETRDLVVKFGGLVALNGINIKINQGELRALIGPNGAGKTTLFDVITGLVKPAQGQVIFEGQNIVSLPPHKICRLGLSRSFQLTSIFPELSVFENVWLGLNAKQRMPWNPLTQATRMTADSNPTEELCRLVGIADKLESLAGNLSHGDQKLLELAIALSLKPRLLLLDEPTQGVSPHEVETINQVIKDIAQSQTVLMIDHNMSTVRELAETISVLHQGKILVEGSPEDIVEDHRVQEIYLGHGHKVYKT